MSIYMWREHIPQELCFTANSAGSIVRLQKTGSPTAVTLETSTDGNTRTTYTIWDTITLNNIWDKVYFRNTSETDTLFSVSGSSYYQFYMSWSISASGDINYLLNKNSTSTLSYYCYYMLFEWCTNLITVPNLPATTLAANCYGTMFEWCTNLTTLPELPATTLADYCYNAMFYWCSKIKLSATQTWAYQTPYRIPITWTWTTANYALSSMFTSTWWTFTWTPSINTTYYTSNTLV